MFTLAFVTLLFGCAWAAQTLPAAHAQWDGRVVVGSDQSVTFDWVGVGATLAVSGTSLSATVAVKCNRGTRMKVWATPDGQNLVDLIPLTSVWVGPQQSNIVLMQGFSASDRLVRWVSIVPPQYFSGPGCEITVFNFTSDGSFGTPPPRPRRIEFIGDSITAATNIMRPAGSDACGDGGMYSDYSAAYEGLLCANFSASCSTVAVGGKCMVRQCGGLQMPDYYLSSLYSQAPAPTYVFNGSAWAPDAVVVHLGTNDYANGANQHNTAFDELFAATVAQFLHNVTVWYNKSDIVFFLPSGPMTVLSLNGTTLALARAQAQGLQAHWIDMTAACTNLPWWSPAPNTDGCDGCAGHPGVHGHIGMFLAAQKVMAAVLGWGD